VLVFAELICGPVARSSSVSSAIGNNLNFLILATVAVSTIFIWDYILTFGMEVDLVWKSKWNFMKGLYLFQRYLPFVDTICFILYCQSDPFPVFLPSRFCRSIRGYFDEDRV